MAITLLPRPKFSIVGANGAPAVGWKIYTWEVSSSTLKPTYTDATGGTANTNPVILDARGEADIWWDGYYKIGVYDENDVLVYTKDNFGLPVFTGITDSSTSTQITITDTSSTFGGSVILSAGTLQQFQGADVASASVLTLGAGNLFDVTGNITINSIASKGIGTVVVLQFDDVLTLTHHATDLILGRDIKTYPGLVLVLYEYATGDWRLVGSNREPQDIKTISASVASNALTLGSDAGVTEFRSATLTDGTITPVYSAALSLVVPSGATLGTVDGIESEIYLVEINNAGTKELACVNISGGNDLSETGVISTTAIDTSADSANVFYSTTARTNVAYRVVGSVTSTQATAGTWATSPTLVQGAGGNALAAMSSLGYGQVWQDLSGSRATGTTYYNTTGKPIYVNAKMERGANTAGYSLTYLTVDGVLVDRVRAYLPTTDETYTVGGIIPPGSSYVITHSGLPSTLYWSELR